MPKCDHNPIFYAMASTVSISYRIKSQMCFIVCSCLHWPRTISLVVAVVAAALAVVVVIVVEVVAVVVAAVIVVFLESRGDRFLMDSRGSQYEDDLRSWKAKRGLNCYDCPPERCSTANGMAVHLRLTQRFDSYPDAASSTAFGGATLDTNGKWCYRVRWTLSSVVVLRLWFWNLEHGLTSINPLVGLSERIRVCYWWNF